MDVSFLGVLKARLNKTVKEAEVKIEELRHLAASLAEASLNELAMSGQIFRKRQPIGVLWRFA